MRRALLTLFLTLCCTHARALHAQAPELARIDSLIGRTRLSDARAALAQWQVAGARNASEQDLAFALLLRARLTAHADSALALYSELAIGHPTTTSAPEALLRLGQGYFAQRDYERAAGHFAQLTRDYPSAPQRAHAFLWLGRAQLARGRRTEGCRALQQGLALRGIADDDRTLLQAEQAECAAETRAAQTGKPNAPAETAKAKSAPAPAQGDYTIQVAAFRDAASARALATLLTQRGIDARVVLVGESSLAQVRAGRFRTRADAATLLQRVRTIVPAAIISDDAAREHALQR